LSYIYGMVLPPRYLGIAGIFDFVDFSEFEKDAAKNGLISNIATYVGHNALRQAVGVPDNRTPANDAQLADMINHVRQSMKDGALGVSFGPFYGPGATYDEMLALAKVAAEYGGCSASHVRKVTRWQTPSIASTKVSVLRGKPEYLLSYRIRAVARLSCQKVPGPYWKPFLKAFKKD